MTQNKTTIIGLTGGTGCGKTTVCSILKKYNAYIIDADKIAHSVIKKGKDAYIQIVDYFGNNILNDDKEIDRKKLGKIVFSDKEKLGYLTKTTHKYIVKEIEQLINTKKEENKYNYIVIDAPLLIEANLHKIVDTVWIVYANLETRIQRLKVRDNIEEDVIINRINSQTSFEENKKFADFVIFNDEGANLEEIIKQQLKKEV